jgi:hypothetical protein
MKLSPTTTLLSSIALASASPCGSPFPRPGPNDVFRLMSIRSGSAIQYGAVQAKLSSFYINSPSQNSTCADPTTNYASFTLSESGDLYLYTDNPPLQAFVDRSGMGQGVFQYSSGVQPIGRNQERGPFKIDEQGNLVFAGNGNAEPTGFQACPDALGGGWSVWLAGATNPGGNEGCVGFTMKALKENEPQKCLYTSYQG